MRIGKRTLIFFTLIGLLVLCGCVAVYFLFSQNLAGSAAPTQIAPGDVEPTEQSPATILTPQVTAQPAIPERRRLTVEFPPQIRAGDSDLVRLTLEVDDLG
jgi:hypothetical protein